MNSDGLFPVVELCRQYEVEVSFIHELHDNGLVEITKIAETEFVETDMLNEVERFFRMHYELAINMEGLEAISHLLSKVENLQQELQKMHNRLSLYEEEP